MDIERMKKLISKNIEVGKAIKHIREVIKNDMHMKQDSYYRTSEDLKPSIDVEKDLIKTITKKQDEVIDAIRGLRLQQPQQGPPPPQQPPPTRATTTTTRATTTTTRATTTTTRATTTTR